MKISEILKKKKLLVSFETFPPKPTADKETYQSIVDAALELSSLHPDFMSVTYGAGGGTSSNTADIASRINNEGGIPALAHLSCISSTKEQVAAAVKKLKDAGIENILALRGDIPEGFELKEPVDVVVRPEDVDIVPADKGMLRGVVTSVTFLGVHYEIIVDINGFKWMIQTTDFVDVDEEIGLYIEPEAIHIMKKSEYSGMFGDYSSYSMELDEIGELDQVEELGELIEEPDGESERAE